MNDYIHCIENGIPEKIIRAYNAGKDDTINKII